MKSFSKGKIIPPWVLLPTNICKYTRNDIGPSVEGPILDSLQKIGSK